MNREKLKQMLLNFIDDATEQELIGLTLACMLLKGFSKTDIAIKFARKAEKQ